MVMVFAVYRIFLHIAQGVVHPTHVPFILEIQPFGAGYVGKRGRFFGNFRSTGRFLLQHGVGVMQKADGFQIFATAVLVGYPLAVVARIIAVNHRGHGIHAQAVEAEALDPIKCIALQEIFHFGAAEVVD